MTLGIFLKIVEIRTKVVSISTFFLAVLASLWQKTPIPVLEVLILFFAVLSLDMATTAFNTFFDFEWGVDDQKVNQEPDKVLVHTPIAPGYALLIAIGLFLLAAGLGLVLVVIKGPTLLLLGLLSFLVAFLYSGGPFPLSSTPLGEVLAGGFLGSVLWIIVQWTIYPLGQSFPWGRSWAMSLPSFFFVAGILAVNNACDRLGDREAGRKTLAILLDRGGAVPALTLPFMAYLTWLLLSLGGTLPVNGLLFAVIGVLFQSYFSFSDRILPFSHNSKNHRMQRVTMSFGIFTFLMTLSFLLGIARLL